MRVFETSVQELKHEVLRSVARLAWNDDLQTGILDIPEEIIPGPEAKMRCCIYKERAIISQRVKMAMGGDKTNPNLVEVLDIACDECPVTEITVGPSCRGCIATRCIHTCPKDAITIVDHKAQIDHKKCITCGKCINACPYGAIEKKTRPCERGCKAGAISMGEDKKAFIDPAKCTSCGACIYQCPFGAIMDKSFIVDAIQMLQGAEKWGFNVYAAVAPSIAGQFAPADLGQVVTGLKMLGFHDVVEVALGADMTAKTEAGELEEKGMLASSCCPAFVDYVEKNFPDQAHLISETPSPMIMAGRYIKRKDPSAKVIFIGPCVAKKMEVKLGKTMRAVDSALTFEELYAMFESRDIDVSKLEYTELDQASGFGRSFAHSGGVSAAVAQALKERSSSFQAKPLPCSGFEACKLAFLKAAKGIGDFNFIEGMACEGGCVQGPAQLIRSPKNQGDVDRHAKQAEGRTIEGAVAEAEKLPESQD